MNQPTTASAALGFSIVRNTLQCAQIKLIKGEPHIEHLEEIILPEVEESDVKPLYTDEDSKIASLAKNYLTVTAIESKDILIRPLELNLTRRRDILSVIEFESEPLIPFPVEETLLDYEIIHQSEKETHLNIFAANVNTIKEHIHLMGSFGLDPEVISCTPAGLATYGYYFGETLKSEWAQFVIHMGLAETTCIISQGAKVVITHSFSQGILDLILKTDVSLDEIDFSNLEGSALKEVKSALEAYCLELGKTLFALSKQSQIENVTEVLLCGEGGLLKNLDIALTNGLNTPISLPVQRFGPTLGEITKYAIPIGLALSALNGSEEQINFRQKEVAYPNPWKRFKTSIVTYLALSLALSVGIFLYTSSWQSYKERQFQQEYSNLLMSMNKTYSGAEKDFYLKMHKGAESQDIEIQPITSLSQQDLIDRLRVLESEVQATPDIFPLLPNAPLVSDVLAWLSTHPIVVVEGDGKPQITIDSFSYTLVKRPDQKKKREKYHVRIDLEFTTLVPKVAREFHDALIAPNEFVDPEEDVKWTATKDKYKASFFLKTRSRTVTKGEGG